MKHLISLARKVTRSPVGGLSVFTRRFNFGRILKKTMDSVSSNHHDDTFIVDLRSDTLSKPTKAMREAMATATDNDDVFREDPTILELENKMAALFGKEAGLFVPSGTMGNLIGICCQCKNRGYEVIMGDRSHTYVKEQGGIAQFGGLHPRPLPNLPDGTFDVELLEASVRPWDDPHEPRTGLIVVENTHNICGGKIIPSEFTDKVRELADKYKIPIHLDGSRILNAAAALDVPPVELCRYADSLNFCFSKGISAPIGSVLVGTKELITEGIRMRKALGGGWRKAGPLAAAALVGMSDAIERLKKDHEHAKLFARSIAERKSKGVVEVDVEGVHTNIIMVDVVKEGLTAEAFCQRLGRVDESERKAFQGNCQPTIIKVRHINKKRMRFVMYSTLTDEHVSRAISKINFVIDELGN